MDTLQWIWLSIRFAYNVMKAMLMYRGYRLLLLLS